MRWFPLDNFKNPAAVARFALTTVIGLAIDLLTKWWAFDRLVTRWLPLPGGRTEPQSDTYAFIPGWLHFHVTVNHGAVFGMGQGQRTLFLAVSVLAITFLTWLFATSGRQRLYQFVLGLLLAGVLGNMYDRIVHGHVRDMIHALPGWSWPQWVVSLIPAGWRGGQGELAVFPWIFNVADCLLCVGVFLMIAYSLFFAPRHERHTTSDASAAPADAKP